MPDEEADVRAQRLRVDRVEELRIRPPAVLEAGFEGEDVMVERSANVGYFHGET